MNTGPLPNVPGPEADAETLRYHYIKWLTRTTIMAYEWRIYACGWCARTDIDLTVRKNGTRDEPMFCSERCRDAKAAFEEKCWPKPKVSAKELERRLAHEEKRSRQAKSIDSYGHGPVRV